MIVVSSDVMLTFFACQGPKSLTESNENAQILEDGIRVSQRGDVAQHGLRRSP